MADDPNVEVEPTDVDEPTDDDEVIEDLEPAYVAGTEPSDDDDDDDDDDPEPKEDPDKVLKDQIAKLEGDKRNLNTALHQARQDKKSKKQEAEELPLTDQQIKDIIKEHGDDPEVLLNIMKYVGERSTQQQANVTELTQMRTNHNTYVAERWPDMTDESTELYQQVGQTRQALQVDNHPLGEYIALSSMICEELPNLQKAAYDQGVEDSKNGTVETKRKTKVKNNTLTPPGRKGVNTKSMAGSAVKTAKQMGLTPSQYKIYQKRILKLKENN